MFLYLILSLFLTGCLSVFCQLLQAVFSVICLKINVHSGELFGGGNENKIQIGASFGTFDEASKCITDFCAKHFHPLSIKRSEVYDRNSAEHHYLKVIFGCIHGGNFRGKGIRATQNSCLACPVTIKVRLLKKPFLHYKITQIFLQHNHDIGPVMFNLYPKQHLLTSNEKVSVTNLVKYNITTKDLKHFIQTSTEKILTSKDVCNLRQELSNAVNSNVKNSEILIEQLNNLIQNDEDCNIILETDENKVFHFLLIQTKVMRLLAQQFPSVLFIDATYKVNIEGFPLYTIMCEDNYGRGRPLCYIFVANEKACTVKPALEKFIELNPSVIDLCKIIVTDKDFNEMNIIKKLFPSVTNILCIFHVLKYFRLKISSLDISNSVKETIRVILKWIVFSQDERQYFDNLDSLETNSPVDFYNYFLNNWHSCKEKFVVAYTKHLPDLGNRTNNRIESHNQKIKSFLRPHMHLCIAVKELITYIKEVSNSITHAIFKDMKSISLKNPSELHCKIASVCTHKASGMIFVEIDKYKEGKYIIQKNADDTYTVQSMGQCYFVGESLNSCSCSFSKQYLLPCQHLFALRLNLNKELFCIDTVAKRWLKSNFQDETLPFPAEVSKQAVVSPGIPLTSAKKFTYARVHTDKLAALLSQCGTKEFQEKLKIIVMLTEAWENNDNVVLTSEKNRISNLYNSNFDLKSDNYDLNVNSSQVYPKKVSPESIAINLGNSASEPEVDSNSENNDQEISSVLSAKDLIIHSIKHRRGRPRTAMPAFRIVKKNSLKVQGNGLPVKRDQHNLNKNINVGNGLKISLSAADYADITSQRMLNDNVINIGQLLIKARFPQANGLQDVLLGSILRFQSISSEFVQVVHCGRFPHWITCSTLGAPPANIYVYDSLNEIVPRDAVSQICQIMNLQSPVLTIISKSMQIQSNGVDCGLFAIASMLTLLSGGNPSDIIYDISRMRIHFLSSLSKGYLSNFPVLNDNNIPKSLERKETFELHCLCRQPKLANCYYVDFRNGFSVAFVKCGTINFAKFVVVMHNLVR